MSFFGPQKEWQATPSLQYEAAQKIQCALAIQNGYLKMVATALRQGDFKHILTSQTPIFMCSWLQQITVSSDSNYVGSWINSRSCPLGCPQQFLGPQPHSHSLISHTQLQRIYILPKQGTCSLTLMA